MADDKEPLESALDRYAKQLRRSLEEVTDVKILQEKPLIAKDTSPYSSNSFSYSFFHDSSHAKISRQSFYPCFFFDQEFQQANQLKQRLLAEYKGQALEDVFSGRVIVTNEGSCFNIFSHKECDFPQLSSSLSRDKILSDLKLLYGIGEITEQQLKAQGYRTIDDLVNHPRFGSLARDFLSPFTEDDYDTIISQLANCYWVSSSHPLLFYAAGFFSPEDFVIIDIETLGLFSRPIILFGVATIHESIVELNQLLLRDITEEPAALVALSQIIDDKAVFISYNGRAFDIPYINQRFAFYGIGSGFRNNHFDLLHFARRAWKNQLPNCQLTTIESHLLGIQRVDDIPSALVPEFYDTYLEQQNVGPLIPIIEHNKQDLLSLATIFAKLSEEWLYD